jgi:hypothetical protein
MSEMFQDWEMEVRPSSRSRTMKNACRRFGGSTTTRVETANRYLKEADRTKHERRLAAG